MKAPRTASALGAVIAMLSFSAPTAGAQGPSVGPGSPAAYRTFKPDGAGPHPAVVLVSGCDGFAPSIAPTLYQLRAEQLRAQGHIAIFADYLGRRGLKTCAGAITPEEAARDVVSAVAWLKARADVDPSRISAIGWSYGGRAVLVALAQHGEKPLALSRVIVYYPDCRALPPWRTALPVLMLLGGDDDMTPAGLCQDVVKRIAAPAAVKVVVYAGARHAFDVSELPARTALGFGSIGYHPEAAASARREVEQFLGKEGGR